MDSLWLVVFLLTLWNPVNKKSFQLSVFKTPCPNMLSSQGLSLWRSCRHQASILEARRATAWQPSSSNECIDSHVPQGGFLLLVFCLSLQFIITEISFYNTASTFTRYVCNKLNSLWNKCCFGFVPVILSCLIHGAKATCITCGNVMCTKCTVNV